MKLHPVIYVFALLILQFFGFGVGVISMLIKDLGTREFIPQHFIPFGFLAFFYLITMMGFKYESSLSKKFLANLFEAQENIK